MSNSDRVFELDERMSDETKIFVRNQMKKMTPEILMQIDIKKARRTQDIYDEEQNINNKFHNLTEKEFEVKSDLDGYLIGITVMIAKNVLPQNPIVIYAHGGGLVFLSRRSYRCSIAHLVEKANCIVISFDYRQCPEHKHPVALEDYKSVVNWVQKSKLDLFGCDEDAPVGLCGDSAGGNMTAVLAHELRGKIDFQILIGPVVNALAEYQSYDDLKGDCYLISKELVKWFVAQAMTDENDLLSPRASPIFYEDFSGLARCLIVVAEIDPLQDDSKMYAKKLSEAKVEHNLVIIKGAVHGFFMHFKECRNALNQCLSAICEFMDRKTT